MKTKIEKCMIKNRRWLSLAAVLFFVGAVFQIAADKWVEAIIYYAASAAFISLERACSVKYAETKKNNERTDSEEGNNE